MINISTIKRRLKKNGIVKFLEALVKSKYHISTGNIHIFYNSYGVNKIKIHLHKYVYVDFLTFSRLYKPQQFYEQVLCYKRLHLQPLKYSFPLEKATK